MTGVEKLMDFEVSKDLKEKNGTYNVKIELGNEVGPYTRECVKVLVSSMIRNNEKGIYGSKLTMSDLASKIITDIPHWVKDEDLVIHDVNISLLKTNKR